MSLGTIFNRGYAVDAGWGIDHIAWERFGPAGGSVRLRLKGMFVVQDVDGAILRVAFHATVQGIRA